MVKIISIIIIHCRLLCNEFKKDIKKISNLCSAALPVEASKIGQLSQFASLKSIRGIQERSVSQHKKIFPVNISPFNNCRHLCNCHIASLPLWHTWLLEETQAMIQHSDGCTCDSPKQQLHPTTAPRVQLATQLCLKLCSVHFFLLCHQLV